MKHSWRPLQGREEETTLHHHYAKAQDSMAMLTVNSLATEQM